MALDLAGCHATRVHADNLGVELGETTLVLSYQDGIEAAIAITRNVQDHLSIAGDHRLLATPVAPVGEMILPILRRIGALLGQMHIQFRSQRPLGKRLGQLSKNAPLAKQITSRTTFHQLIQYGFVDAHMWPSSNLELPRQSTKF